MKQQTLAIAAAQERDLNNTAGRLGAMNFWIQ